MRGFLRPAAMPFLLAVLTSCSATHWTPPPEESLRASRGALTPHGGLDFQSVEGGNVATIRPASLAACGNLGLPADAAIVTANIAAAGVTPADPSQDSYWYLVGTTPFNTAGKIVNALTCSGDTIVIGSDQGLEWISKTDLTSGSFSTASVLNGNAVSAVFPLDATHVLAGVQNTNNAAPSAIVTCDVSSRTCTSAASGFPSFGGGDFVRAFARTSAGTILVGLAASGIFRSTDGGHTFAAANTGLSFAFGARGFVVNGSDVYAAAAGGVYKSSNDGAGWTSVSSGLPSGLIFPGGFAGSGTTLYTAISSVSDDTAATFWRTTNGGASWTAAGTGLTATTVNDLAVTPAAVWAATNAGVFRSTDGGATFAPFNRGLNNTNVYRVATNGTTLFAGVYANSNGVFRSADNGRTWQPSSAFLNNRLIRTVAAIGSNVVAGGESGTYRSTDGGATFAAARAGLSGSSNVYALAASGSTLYAALFPAGFARSADGGATWTMGAAPSSSQSTAVATDGTTVVVAAGGVVHRSMDGGASWAHGATIVPTDPGNYLVYGLSFASGALYAGLQGFGYVETHGLARSTDFGASWTRPTGFPANVDVYDVEAAGGVLYAGTGRGLYTSTDGGQTWSPVYPDLAATSVLSIVPQSGTLQLGTYGRGLFSIAQPAAVRRLLPIVLDVDNGTVHYTTDMALTNAGAADTNVTLLYTSSSGAGTGTVTDTLAAGRQLLVPDVLEYLRGKGLAIPRGGTQVGTLLATFTNLSDENTAFLTARTTAATSAPQPAGAAGLAYSSLDPVHGATDALRVFGLRENASDRSNVAVYNSGDVPVTVRVTVSSGDGSGASTVLDGGLVLPPWGWTQFNRVLSGPGYASGWVTVERASVAGAFGAYGVINDQTTNDGSFIPASRTEIPSAFLDVPVLVETPAFRSELVLTNASASPATFTLTFTESLASGSSATSGPSPLVPPVPVQVVLPPYTVSIDPEAVDWLRQQGGFTLPKDAASYAGSLHVVVSGTQLNLTSAGARSAARSPAGGQFGFFSPARFPGEVGFDVGGMYGLRADANDRTNLAVMNRAASGSSLTIRATAWDGDTGLAKGTLDFTLGPGKWAQTNDFLAPFGITNGYVTLQRTSGNSPWDAYAVVNDGRSPGQRTGDGAFLTLTTRYSF
jgi:hypothetical protein